MSNQTPRWQHPAYNGWLDEQASYYKRNLDDACSQIAKLIVENRELKETLKEYVLPSGERNTLRGKPRGETTSKREGNREPDLKLSKI